MDVDAVAHDEGAATFGSAVPRETQPIPLAWKHACGVEQRIGHPGHRTEQEPRGYT